MEEEHSMEEEIDADRLWSSLDKVGLKGVVEGLGEREHTFITRLFQKPEWSFPAGRSRGWE